MNKKGVDLAINTIILAVLVVLVLIVVTTFFLGGFGRVTEVISRVFFPITAGTDLAIAAQNCDQRCDQAKLLPDNLQRNSAFCNSAYNIDKNGDGSADRVGGVDSDKSKPFVKYYCYRQSPITGESESLGITCQIDGKPLQC
jgi:hypothetical protein